MINSHIASIIISSVEGCSDCGTIEHKLALSKTYASHFIEIGLDDRGVTVYTGSSVSGSYSTVNNLNETIEIQSSTASSVSPINLTYYHDGNVPKLVVSQT